MEIKANYCIPTKYQKTILDSFSKMESLQKYNTNQYTILLGFCDVHVHFREPGFSYKETIKTGALAAARGGYTSVLTMPNLNPVPDSIENLQQQLDIINQDACIEVLPYGAITVGEKGEELSDMDGMKDNVVAFSDDGRGLQRAEMMEKAMIKAKSLGKIIVAHCEVNSLLNGGYIHDGKYAKLHNHKGICSASEYEQIARDCEIAKKVGAKYHVCHISTKESVEIIRQAKKDGVDVTCETAPHYLILDDSMLKEEGKWKMNPPLRDISDKEALIQGIIDGTIDCIATDHAPHSQEEKAKGLEKSPFGIVGIETAFQELYTNLVLKNVITLEKALELLVVNPRNRFNIALNEDFSIWDLNKKVIIDPKDFLSMGKATPFEGNEVIGENQVTVYNGNIVYRKI
ncbi:MAG: dihydroorotase [Clostridiales bacterium]|nr:dihydroorotase [Clostridiales bacterium]